jgi:O-Antigen ligase
VGMSAAAATVPLGAGLYLSYSRGALAVAVLGLLILVAAAPSRGQLRAAVIALAALGAASLATAAFPGVASLEGNHREAEGAAALAILAVLAAAAAFALRPQRPGGDRPLAFARSLGPAAAAITAAVALALALGGIGERASDAELARGAGAGRLTTVNSNRYEYWRVAVDAFKDEPLTGLGAGGFRTEWLKQREIAEAVKDTHSLELEFAAELGLLGLLGFGLAVGGIAAAGRTALQRNRELAAGATAAALVWLLHASIDWDWQLPAVTLPAIVLSGALIVIAERSPDRAAAEQPAPVARSQDPSPARS